MVPLTMKSMYSAKNTKPVYATVSSVMDSSFAEWDTAMRPVSSV